MEMQCHGALGFARVCVSIHILLPGRESDSAALPKFSTVTVKGDNQITAEAAEAFAVVM